MAGYQLVWKSAPAGTLDASSLRPDVLGRVPIDVLGEQRVTLGRSIYSVRDLFNISGEPGDTLTVPGYERYFHLARGMTGGTLRVLGHAGDLAGMEMTGGTLRIDGDAGASLGASMLGGRITVTGDTGPATGGPSPNWTEGMTQGEILIEGKAGPQCGVRQRGGLIAVNEADEFAGYHMLAGTLLIRRGALHSPGVALRRGTILSLDASIDPSWSPRFLFDCQYRPVFIRVLLKHLQGTGFAVPGGAFSGEYRLYSGDRLTLGKGEILHWVR